MNELKIPTNLECNSIEIISLNEQTNYRLMEISKSKDYFDQEINLDYSGMILTGFF